MSGRIKITFYGGGYPVWCQLHVDDQQVAQLRHDELMDLKHEVERAMRDVRVELKRINREDEV